MAQTILSVAEKLALITWNEAYFLSGVSEQSESLKNKIRLMRSALVDASEKRRNNKEAEEWLNQVRDAVMEAEDVIDLFIFRAQRQRQRCIATRYICFPSLLFNRHMLGNRIEISNKKIEHLSDKRSTLGLVTAEAGQSSNEQPGLVLPFHRRDEQGLPFRGRDSVEEFAVIGFQKEEKEVIAKLMAHKKSTPPFPSVVSIVGMGGSGKTTLARKVFKNPHVVQHFSTRAWVSISQQFVAKEILRAITDQIHPLSSDEKKKVEEEKKELDEGSLISRLSSFLKDKTYLIVFDDLWRPEHWEKLKQTLPVQQQNYQSSKVLFTTRNEDVATYADPFADIYYQPLLTEDESWKLFLAKVMLESKDDAAGGPTLQHDLVELGRKIVGKCRGLPLAIVLLGGLLSRRPKSHAAWSKVHASVNSALNANEAGISCKQVLGLSYTDLPDQLKPCFLYVGVFPEDYEIECSRLIWLWVAEGFIQPRDQLTMEDVAEEYLEELAKRSMIQITWRNYDGRGIFCRIHDLVRDLAISEAKQERFLQVLVVGSSDDDTLRSSSSLNKSCRRLSITRGESSTSNALNQGTRENYLHSFLCFSGTFSTINLRMKLKLLRVLDLQGVRNISRGLVEQLIGKLILLKYLSLRNTLICGLPSSIGDLQNLQTLDLREIGLHHLPVTMINLRQLRNLLFSIEVDTDIFPDLLHHNVNLQKLMLPGGKWIGKLDKLTNLRELTIFIDDKFSSCTESLLNAIPKLNRLRSFKLTVPHVLIGIDTTDLPASFSCHWELYNMVLKRVVRIRDFPPNLTTLVLHLCEGQETNRVLQKLKMLPSLRCLFLCGPEKSKITLSFTDDGFHQLKELTLFDIHDLEFNVEEGALPNLKVLKIIGCTGLERIPQGLKQVVTLQELLLLDISLKLQDQVRKYAGEDWGIIKHIPYLYIELHGDASIASTHLRELWFESDAYPYLF